MNKLRNKNALVTGGSRGIGPHIARALASKGVNVVVTARSAELLQKMAASIEEMGVRSAAIPVDIKNSEERKVLVKKTIDFLGSIDILINNAGVESEGAFIKLDPEIIDMTVQTNVLAPMHLTHLVLPQMLKNGEGHIVNISSIAGKKSPPYEAVYGGTKAALIEWTSALRIELEGTGVSLSVICPGFVTGEGMFAKCGMKPPKTVGSCTPQQVANATVRAIKRNQPEVIVNSLPIRPLLAISALFPRFSNWFINVMGITEFQRKRTGG
ncbi:MAG: SDR family NAD(P)-dependent oxidoreductase [Cytophagales bacterium]|nr:SDR family NAD(P)-dependent oxidoreductase [Cytophagales bacterium]